MSTYSNGTWFETETCCNCGMQFAMTTDYYNRRRKDRKSFYCPAGHAQYYTGKTEEQKLRDKLNKAQLDLQAESGRAILLEQEKREIQNSYGKMRNRVKNGVCPCCTRTFQNLLNHMRTQHPEFGESKILKSLRESFGLTQTALSKEIGVSASYISNYEREKYAPQHAVQSIEYWVSCNE